MSLIIPNLPGTAGGGDLILISECSLSDCPAEDCSRLRCQINVDEHNSYITLIFTLIATICDRIWENPSYGIFFLKIEFDAWLISSSIELTRVQVLGRLCASLWRYSALFAIAPHPQ